jgi:hypothetical protein
MNTKDAFTTVHFKRISITPSIFHRSYNFLAFFLFFLFYAKEGVLGTDAAVCVV